MARHDAERESEKEREQYGQRGKSERMGEWYLNKQMCKSPFNV